MFGNLAHPPFIGGFVEHLFEWCLGSWKVCYKIHGPNANILPAFTTTKIQAFFLGVNIQYTVPLMEFFGVFLWYFAKILNGTTWIYLEMIFYFAENCCWRYTPEICQDTHCLGNVVPGDAFSYCIIFGIYVRFCVCTPCCYRNQQTS